MESPCSDLMLGKVPSRKHKLFIIWHEVLTFINSPFYYRNAFLSRIRFMRAIISVNPP